LRLSAALASLTVRLHEGGSETRKVEAVALNERIGYVDDDAAAAVLLVRRSGVEAEALQPSRMGQSPEKPKGYGTPVLPHWRSHRTPPLTAAAAAEEEEVAWRRKGRRRK